MATVTISVKDFSGGKVDYTRKPSPNEFFIAKHFDSFTDPHRLIPYRDFETDTSDGGSGIKTRFVRDFLYASTSSKLYGLGQNGSGQTKILFKSNAISGNWTQPTSSEGNGVVKNGCLVEYKNYLWGFQGTNQVFKWGTLSGTPTITNTAGTVGTIDSVAQGIIGLDDNLYLPYNNKLVRVTSGGTVNDAVLTIPSNFKITSLANYGKYLAIGCSPVSNFNGVSKVFIWNLTAPDVQDVIDWGEGELRVLESIEGYLVGITDRYLNSDVGAGRGSMIIQMYSGGVPQVVKEVFTQKLTGVPIPLSKAVRNNRVFFAARIYDNTTGTEFSEGLWSFGRKSASYPFALNLDYVSPLITDGIQGFGAAGNFFFLGVNSDGEVLKTNDAPSYTQESIYDGVTLDFGDVEAEKRIDSLKVSFARLQTGQSVAVEVKTDDNPVWTSVGTYNTVNSTSKTFKNASGSPFPIGKEIKVRLKSTGGLEITGYKIVANILNQA